MHNDGARGSRQVGRSDPFALRRVAILVFLLTDSFLPEGQESACVGGHTPFYVLSRNAISGPSSPQTGGADTGGYPMVPHRVDGWRPVGTSGAGSSLCASQSGRERSGLSPLGPNGLNKDVQDQFSP